MHTQDPTHPTGISDDSPAGGSNVARARSRKANAALQLRIAGATWTEIAESLGYPTGDAAQVATELALERELASEGSKKHMRSLASRRFERMLRSVWAKATNPEDPDHLVALDRAVKILDRHAKLHGLDAPTEFVVSSPTVAEIEQWVARVQASSQPVYEEADIFDAEVVSDSGDPGMVNDPSQAVQSLNPGSGD